MKAFFKKLVGKDKPAKQTPEEESKEESKQPARQKIPCTQDQHREPPFKCWNDHCMSKVCQQCAQPPNENGEILCNLCMLSANNLNMEFGSSDEEETKNFSGAGLNPVARVSFDPHTS